MEEVVEFSSHCMKLKTLFESFNIIPSRKDEKKKIKQLNQSSSKQLGQNWFVINQKWWENWSSYVDWENNDNDHDNDNDNDNDKEQPQTNQQQDNVDTNTTNKTTTNKKKQ